MTNTSVTSPPLDPFHCLLSSRDMGWKGILVEQYQNQLQHQLLERSFSALSEHWLNFHLTEPFHLTQRHDERLHESLA
jgi:AraC family transcriptional regulator